MEWFVKRTGLKTTVERVDLRWYCTVTEDGHTFTSDGFDLTRCLKDIEKLVLAHRRIKVCTAQNWKCANCGKMARLQVHHKIPLAKGGTHDISNLVALCRDCHEIWQYRAPKSD